MLQAKTANIRYALLKTINAQAYIRNIILKEVHSSSVCHRGRHLGPARRRCKDNKKHLKNVGPIRHCEPFYIAIHQVLLLSHAAMVARRLHIDVYNDNNDDDNDNA